MTPRNSGQRTLHHPSTCYTIRGLWYLKPWILALGVYSRARGLQAFGCRHPSSPNWPEACQYGLTISWAPGFRDLFVLRFWCWQETRTWRRGPRYGIYTDMFHSQRAYMHDTFLGPRMSLSEVVVMNHADMPNANTQNHRPRIGVAVRQHGLLYQRVSSRLLRAGLLRLGDKPQRLPQVQHTGLALMRICKSYRAGLYKYTEVS